VAHWYGSLLQIRVEIPNSVICVGKCHLNWTLSMQRQCYWCETSAQLAKNACTVLLIAPAIVSCFPTASIAESSALIQKSRYVLGFSRMLSYSHITLSTSAPRDGAIQPYEHAYITLVKYLELFNEASLISCNWTGKLSLRMWEHCRADKPQSHPKQLFLHRNMLFSSTVGRIIALMDEGVHVFSDIFMMHSTVEDTKKFP